MEDNRDKVGAQIGITRNLGNYNNVKLDGWWETRVEEGETTEDAFDRVFRKVESVIEKELEEYESD